MGFRKQRKRNRELKNGSNRATPLTFQIAAPTLRIDVVSTSHPDSGKDFGLHRRASSNVLSCGCRKLRAGTSEVHTVCLLGSSLVSVLQEGPGSIDHRCHIVLR